MESVIHVIHDTKVHILRLVSICFPDILTVNVVVLFNGGRLKKARDSKWETFEVFSYFSCVVAVLCDILHHNNTSFSNHLKFPLKARLLIASMLQHDESLSECYCFLRSDCINMGTLKNAFKGALHRFKTCSSVQYFTGSPVWLYK